jgi:autoinducer 2-binding periplasmic protein LuxP
VPVRGIPRPGDPGPGGDEGQQDEAFTWEETEMKANTLTQGMAASLLALSLGLGGIASAQTLPLTPLPDDGDRYFWWYYQVQTEEVLENMQAIVGGPATPMASPPADPVKIAVIYPSQDVSDFWLRSYLAMEARFNEMGMPFEAVQFASNMGDFLLQSTYAEQVAQDDFDYVIFGPSELQAQQDDIKLLMDSGKKVIVLNYDTAIQEWGDDQPMMYTTFSHLFGALNICNWVVENLGTEGTYAMIRGIPGGLDDQRSGGFRDCLAEKSNWVMAYEHYGDFQREGGFNGAQLISSAYPEVTLIHNANTAMAMGAISAVQAAGLGDKIGVTAWGGTGDEIDALKNGELLATPMRMSDDVGVAMAEAIRMDVEGRVDEIPQVFLGRIDIVSGQSTPEDVEAKANEAFRYTGRATLER